MRRNKGNPIDVKYRVFKTSWGDAGVAWTSKGVCKLVLPGLARSMIKAEIIRAFPGASEAKAGEARDITAQVAAYFNGRLKKFTVQPDLSGASPFQAKVYRALMGIPYGQTRSYAEVAKTAGSPGASRAAGSANACNNVPLIIPCHRVIKSDGSLGGFSAPGGVKLKKRLLDLEKGARP